jgi:opacity protein-like surface antigen
MFNTLSKILFLLAIILASPRLFAETSQAVTLHIEVPFVELHSGPSAGYPVVHILEKNEDVTVLVKRTSWLKVKDKRGNEGWIHENDLLGLSQYGEAIKQGDDFQQSFKNRDVEGGVMYGDLEGANFYNVYLGYAFTPVFSAEISAGKALGNISDSNLYEIMLISQPMPDWVVTPYIGIGGGFIDTKPHSVLADSESRQSTLMSAAVGIKYHIARNFLIRAEYKHSLALTDRDKNEEIQTWKIGFSVFF